MSDLGHELLLVTPNVEEAEAYNRLLVQGGFRVTIVGDGRAALQTLVEREVAPEAMLLVGAMGRMGGWELLAVARSYLRFWALPVLIISGDPVARLAREAFAYLEHPAPPEAVLALVTQMTDRRNQAAG
jgi:CheY-like chemotaxis protein